LQLQLGAMAVIYLWLLINNTHKLNVQTSLSKQMSASKRRCLSLAQASISTVTTWNELSVVGNDLLKTAVQAIQQNVAFGKAERSKMLSSAACKTQLL